MQIDIKITELLSKIVTVDANSIDEAKVIVEDMYKNEEIVLDYNDFNQDVIIEKEESDISAIR